MSAPHYTFEAKPGHCYRFHYTNHRGEYEERHVIFRELAWGSTEWYPDLQFFFTGFDVDKDEVRSFRLSNIDIRKFARFTDVELKIHLNPAPDDPIEEENR